MQRSKRIPGIKEALMFKAETCDVDDTKNVKKYRSKIDWWLGSTCIGLFVFAIALSVYQLTLGEQVIGLGILISIAIVAALLALIGMPTQYTITEQQLIVRAGLFFRWNISLGTIREVFPIVNMESAPAWSLKRLRINYTIYTNATYILIAPQDPVAFLQEIVNRCPQLSLVDDRAVYRASLYQ